MKIFMYIIFFIISSSFAAELDYHNGVGEEFGAGPSGDQRGLGQYGYPSDPISDRAKGYLLKGKVKNAVSNYGNFITWDEHPAGLWGEYTYLPHVAMVAGIPGHEYSSHYQDWEESDMATHYEDWHDQYGEDLIVWCSEDLYDAWSLDPELLTSQDLEAQAEGFPSTIRPNGKYIGMVFDTEDDRGIVGERQLDIGSFDAINQWAFDFYNTENDGGNSRVCITVRSDDFSIDPNLSNAMIGAMYPWALRPALKERMDEFDLYEYGPDGDDWTEDDEYMYHLVH